MSDRSGTLISLESVSLMYRLAKQRIPSFKEYAVHWLRGALVYEELWALKDVSLRIGRGESVGIIGHNGAGKSTLLKVVSRVFPPSRGRLTVRGQVVPILELGAGFDPELTGMENIQLNALLLGHTHGEINAAAPSIVVASGLGDFVRSPIRNYSSGMLARLGFSVATAWVPDILIVDEVLAVGDAAFQEQCRERMHEFRSLGTTMLLVSHDLEGLKVACDRCIWLEAGRVRADGPSATVIDEYREYSHSLTESPLIQR